MRILAGILMALYMGLTFFGLYQYKAHDRSWGAELVLRCSFVVLAGGVGSFLLVRFCLWQFWLNASIAIAMSLFGFLAAWLTGSWLAGVLFAGWKRHLFRGVSFALFLGPLAAVRFSELNHFNMWLRRISDIPFMEMLKFILYGLPGFFLVGAASFLVSLGYETWRKPDDELPTVAPTQRTKVGYGFIFLALLLCINWYVVGMSDPYECAEDGDKGILTYIFWSRPGSLNTKDFSGWTPLHRAIRDKHTEAVKILLGAGAEVNVKTKDGWTPLHGAPSPEVVKILLDAGADVNAKTKNGWTPLHHGSPSPEVVKILLDAGADVNAKTKNGKTPLHMATSSGSVKLLFKAGAAVNAREKFGTPLHIAVEWGFTEVTKALIEAGADINIKNMYGKTPLYRAVEEGRTEIAKQLLKAQAEVNITHKHGYVPVHWAALFGQTEVVNALIQAGAEVNATNDYDETPLLMAASRGHTGAVRLLIDAGAEVNATNDYDETPLLMAAFLGQTGAARLLIQAGANVNARDKDGRTPMDMARERKPYIDSRKQDECGRLLRKHGAKTGAELDAEAKQGKQE